MNIPIGLFSHSCAPKRIGSFVLFLVVTCPFAWAEKPFVLREFEKNHITPHYWAEGASIGDLNRDGKLDLVFGGHYHLGPDYSHRYEYTVPIPANKRGPFDQQVYTLEHFFSWVYDFNRDGWPDILVVPIPGRAVSWYENPATFAAKQEVLHWKKHLAMPTFHIETSIFEDLTGDGLPELVCGVTDRIGYAAPDFVNPTEPWKFVPISDQIEIQHWQRNAHGLGIGDVNGDGRKDVLRPNGWWEQPTKPAGARWEFHPFRFVPENGKEMLSYGGAEMYAEDINGDGWNDVITSMDGHGWGLSWFEQLRPEAGKFTFREHVLLSREEKGEGNPYRVQFSQLHAVALVDIDRDGHKDILTGKTYLAHDFFDPGYQQPPVIYWFQWSRTGGKVEFVPHLIDDKMGIGRRIDTADINNDGLPDFVIGNKNGLAVFIQKTRAVSEAEWIKAQPKKISE